MLEIGSLLTSTYLLVFTPLLGSWSSASCRLVLGRLRLYMFLFAIPTVFRAYIFAVVVLIKFAVS